MTLFNTLVSNGVACSISDILLTQDGDGNSSKNPSPSTGLRAETEGFEQAGHTLKSIVISTREMFQWSGSALIARAVLREYLSKRQYYKGMHWQELLKSFSQADLEQVAFAIYFFKGDKLLIFRCNCENRNAYDIDETSAGSGDFLLSESYFNAPDLLANPFPYGRPFNIQTTRIAKLLLGELGTYEYHSFRAGGWYELVGMREKRIWKIPYAILLWESQQDGLGLQRIAHSYYEKETLFIRNFELKDGGNDYAFAVTPFGRTRPVDIRGAAISDALFKPRLRFHFVLDGDSIGSLVSYSTENKFEFMARRSEVKFFIHSDEMTKLDNLISNKPQHP